MEDKKTLYIGAHPDDVFIGSGITIHRSPEKAHVLTITNGAQPFQKKYPLEAYGFRFNNSREYAKQRLQEDKKAMKAIGIPSKKYDNLSVPDSISYLHILKILEEIGGLVNLEGIERIVTHEFPQAHPDHEVVSICSHIIGKRKCIEVWEYPMYRYNSQGEKINCEFINGQYEETITTKFTEKEIALKDRLIQIYKSQGFLRKSFRTTKEIFGKIDRDLSKFEDTVYLPGMEEEINPEEIRRELKKVLLN